MGLIDIFKKKTVDKLPEETMIKHGKSGTEIMSGMIQEEYNNDLVFPESVKVYDEMRKSDATVAAVLKALKNPLLSAEWDIQSGGDSDRDKEVAEFVNRNLFVNINFQDWLREVLTYLDFGFRYFEKVYQVKNGMIEWKELASRVQRAHYIWGVNGEEWINGHPAGITQVINSNDEGGEANYPEIPWGKLILFSNEREGNNYEGVSILRPGYKHYFYKDLGYRIQSVSSERYGVGVPVATVKNSMSTLNRTKVEEFLKNIRSNEKSFGLLTDEVTKFEIMTPTGSGVGSDIQSMIDHHDKKLYDLILAGFLNLSSGDGGSNALSKDQSSFFLRGLQSVADYIVSVMNEQIKELVDMNYSGVVDYPTLFVSEIGQTSMDESIGAINTAVSGGLLTLVPNDIIAVRAMLKLPPLPPPDEEDTAIEELEAEMDIEGLHIGTLEDFSAEAGIDEPADDSGKTIQNPEVEKKLAEIIEEHIQLGKPLTDEHKKNISEALQKALPGPTKDVQAVREKMGTVTDMQERDPVLTKYQNQKTQLTSMFEGLKTAVQAIRDKRSGMSKPQKKKFAIEFKARLDELKVSRKSLQEVSSGLKKQISDRKGFIGGVRKETNAQLKAIKDKQNEENKTQKEIEKEAKKRNKKLSEDTYQPTAREKAFTQNISDFELYLEMKYAEAESCVAMAEKEYTEALVELYDGSTSERVDGVVCLVYDKTKITAGKNKINAITKRLEKKLLGGNLETDIFKTAIASARSTLEENEMKLSYSLEIPQGQINTFIEGYKSNMQGVIFNESRRVLENITLNYGSEASLELAKDTAKAVTFNKNILTLSFITHPRALYKYIIYDEAQAAGFTLFKTVVPNNRIADLIARPFGITAGVAYTVMTAAQINAYAAATTAGKTAEAAAGLGLHHGSFEYYYPISSVDIDTEIEIAKIQRENLFPKN